MADNSTTTAAPPGLTLEENYNILKSNLDSFFLIIMGIVVFLMQCGFAFLEAGSVRSKNTVNILIKNMLDCLIGGVAYWAIGYAVAYGDGGNGFIGTSYFFGYQMPTEKYPFWFFQFVFAATAATIVSGSIAERTSFVAYLVYSIVITGWVYPPVTHWAWDSNGWLAGLGFSDFAGSGVVHVLGATCAFWACYIMGPRLGRFEGELGKDTIVPGHSVPLAGLGGFILLFGFLAFNGGSQLTITNEGDAEAVGLVIVNTILGGCGGGLAALTVSYIQEKKWKYLVTLNGALTGMVAQCAGCNVFQPWAALLIGLFAGLVFHGVSTAMIKGGLDDPLDAVAVHGGGGILGVLCVPFFSYGTGIFWAGNTTDAWKALGINLAGLLAIIAWATFWCILMFAILNYYYLLRIDAQTEIDGNDLVKHGEAAYPKDAWIEKQYKPSLAGMMFRPSISMINGDINLQNVSTENKAYEPDEMGSKV